MMSNNSLLSNDEGQSTIEFLVCFSLVVGLMFLFLKVAINTTNGYLVHYANFMASRTYLVVDVNASEFGAGDRRAFTEAEKVFNSYNIDGFIPGFNGEFKANSPATVANRLFVGTYVQYNDMFSVSDQVGGKHEMTYLSESFLGREPVRAECLARICKAMRGLGSNCEVHTTFFDNGC